MESYRAMRAQTPLQLAGRAEYRVPTEPIPISTTKDTQHVLSPCYFDITIPPFPWISVFQYLWVYLLNLTFSLNCFRFLSILSFAGHILDQSWVQQCTCTSHRNFKKFVRCYTCCLTKTKAFELTAIWLSLSTFYNVFSCLNVC